jgi:hypothetical protein
MDKLLELDDRFPKTGEPTVQLVAWRGARGGLSIEKRAFTESRSPLYDFLSTVQPESGVSYILVNALGAYEYYDDNRNGDGFPNAPYKVGELAACGHPECTAALDGWISEPETLRHHYPSFEKHGGIYKHHVNKDPTKSLGYINKAILNPYMHRVELLLKLVNGRDPEIAQRIGDGDFPAVSMGCHVRWDVCTICGHRAPTRAQYCEHALRMLRRILPDGRKVAVLNPSPKFFDISFVFRPADPTGWMLKKVAGETAFRYSADLGEQLRAYEARAVEIRSRCEKTAAALGTAYGVQASSIVQEWPQLSAAVYATAKTAGVTSTLATLAANGVVLATGEVIDLFAKAANVTASSSDLDRLVALEPVLTEIIARYPDVETKLGSLVALRVDAVNDDVARPLSSWIEKRGGIYDYVRQQAYSPTDLFQLPIGPGAHYRATEPAKTDVLSLSDPYTGTQYQTTRGAAMAAHNEDAKAQLGSTALLGALYAGGLRAALGPGSGVWSLPIGLAAGYATQRALRKQFRPHRYNRYVTDQGLPVSGGTEFVKVSGYDRPSRADVVHKAAFDLIERVGAPDYNALLKKVARENGAAYAQWLETTPLHQKVATLVSGAEIEAHDVQEAPGLNVARLVENISRLVWR